MDAKALVNRLAVIDSALNGDTPVADNISINLSFNDNPELKGHYTIHSREASNFIDAVKFGITPLQDLNNVLESILGMFYPADNLKHEILLDYYKQREWRIASSFVIDGNEVTRPLRQEERDKLLEIDSDFFGRKIESGLGEVDMLDATLALPGLGGIPLIELVRRIIVPGSVVDVVRQMLGSLSIAPNVISLDDL